MDAMHSGVGTVLTFVIGVVFLLMANRRALAYGPLGSFELRAEYSKQSHHRFDRTADATLSWRFHGQHSMACTGWHVGDE